MLRTRITWVIGGAVVVLLIIAGVDALRSSLGEPRAAVGTAPTHVSNQATACKRSEMVVAIEVRKPDETRPVWNQRDQDNPGWRAWRRTPVATLVVRNAGSSDCVLVHGAGTYDFGIRDRAGRWMARWDGVNVFPGQYAPAQERTFSLPNVFSCDRPGPFSATATVGHSSARLKGLTYDQVTCTRDRLTSTSTTGTSSPGTTSKTVPSVCTARDKSSDSLAKHDGYFVACNPGLAVVTVRGTTYRITGSMCFLGADAGRLHFGSETGRRRQPARDDLYLVIERRDKTSVADVIDGVFTVVTRANKVLSGIPSGTVHLADGLDQGTFAVVGRSEGNLKGVPFTGSWKCG